MEVDRRIGVHRTHCCLLHGCKYGEDDTCPVVQKEVEQAFLCEDCGYDGIKDFNEFDDVVVGRVEKCPHCGHTL